MLPRKVLGLNVVSMGKDRRGNHTVCNLSVHLVWVTKYRYPVLNGDLKVRCRDLLRQVCMTLDVRIMKGVVSKDHVHMHVDYPPTLCVSELVKRLKGRSSRLLQKEYPSLRKRYWGRHFWAIGYGCWSTGNITEEMVNQYLEHHRNESSLDDDDFILE